MFGFFKKKQQRVKSQGKKTVRSFSYNSATSKLIKSWMIYGADPDDIIESQYMSLVYRARNGYCNNDYIKGFVNQACINIVGHNGVRIQSKYKNENLNKKIERSFKKWSKKGNCDVTGRMSFVDVQLMCVRSLLRDGEFFVTKNIIDGHLQLNVLEPTNIDVAYRGEVKNGNKIINGIEINSYGRAIAYYFLNDDQTRTRIPADRMIHGYIQEFVGQKRGVSAVATALIRLGLLGEFETAAIDHARQAAKIMAFASKPVNDYQPMSTSYDEDEPKTTSIDLGEGAHIPVVDDGLDIKNIDSQFPSSEYGNFKDAILRAISLSLGYGVNFINMGNNLEKVNYSSARQGLLSERDAWKLLQKLIIDSLISPIFESWFEVECLSGRLGMISDSTFDDVIDKVRYQPRSWQWIDPVKDAKGISENINNKTTSISEAILESGRDPDEVFEQQARDKKRMKDLGIYAEANQNTTDAITTGESETPETD